jgi:hypothetical protein
MKTKHLLLTIPLILIFLTLPFLKDHSTILYFAYASPSDAYGNDVTHVEVWEDDTLKGNYTSSEGSVRVNASKTIKFVVGIKFNSTLASSQSEAINYTQVLMNITAIWTNKELNNTSCTLANGFYWLKEEGILSPNTLSEGQTYDYSVLYKAYY